MLRWWCLSRPTNAILNRVRRSNSTISRHASEPVGSEEFAALWNKTGIPVDTPMVLNVSGGVDSMAMAFLMQRLFDSQPTPVKPSRAVVFDHQQRAQTAHDNTRVADILKSVIGISHVELLTLDLKPNSSQEMMRKARSRANSELARKHGSRYLVTAHHADDQLETFVFRLAAASYLNGLGAMEIVRASPRASLDEPLLYTIRPLLDIPKSRLIATCKAHNIEWFEDPSNKMTSKYQRNRVRKDLSELPTLDNITALFTYIKDYKAAVDVKAREFIENPINARFYPYRRLAFLRAPHLESLPIEVIHSVLRYTYEWSCHPLTIPTVVIRQTSIAGRTVKSKTLRNKAVSGFSPALSITDAANLIYWSTLNAYTVSFHKRFTNTPEQNDLLSKVYTNRGLPIPANAVVVPPSTTDQTVVFARTYRIRVLARNYPVIVRPMGSKWDRTMLLQYNKKALHRVQMEYGFALAAMPLVVRANDKFVVGTENNSRTEQLPEILLSMPLLERPLLELSPRLIPLSFNPPETTRFDLSMVTHRARLNKNAQLLSMRSSAVGPVPNLSPIRVLSTTTEHLFDETDSPTPSPGANVFSRPQHRQHQNQEQKNFQHRRGGPSNRGRSPHYVHPQQQKHQNNHQHQPKPRSEPSSPRQEQQRGFWQASSSPRHSHRFKLGVPPAQRTSSDQQHERESQQNPPSRRDNNRSRQ